MKENKKKILRELKKIQFTGKQTIQVNNDANE